MLLIFSFKLWWPDRMQGVSIFFFFCSCWDLLCVHVVNSGESSTAVWGTGLQHHRALKGVHWVNEAKLFSPEGVREKDTHKPSWCFPSLFLFFYSLSFFPSLFYIMLFYCFYISQQNLPGTTRIKRVAFHFFQVFTRLLVIGKIMPFISLTW